MGDLGLVPWLISFAIFFVFPFWKILDRIGFKPAFSLVALVPGGVLVLLWVIALAKWPALPQVKKNGVPPDSPTLPGPDQAL
jgi:hypothetical protein